MIRRTAGMGILFALLLLPRTAAAAPIQLTFSGTWGFWDPQSDLPTFWSAMGAYGVTQGTPLTFSLIIDDSTQTNANGVYVGAIQQVEFTVGSLSLGCTGTACSPTTNGSGQTLLTPGTSYSPELWTGPSMSGLPSIGNGFVPSFFNLHAFLPLTVGTLADALADPSAWSAAAGGGQPNASLLIGFADGPNGPGGGGVFLGTSSLTFVGETRAVPEPTSIAFVCVGLGLLLLRRRRSRLSWR